MDPYGAASHSTGCGLQKDKSCLQHLSCLAKSIFFILIPAGKDTNRAALHWDSMFSRKVSLYLSLHYRDTLEILPSNQERE